MYFLFFENEIRVDSCRITSSDNTDPKHDEALLALLNVNNVLNYGKLIKKEMCNECKVEMVFPARESISVIIFNSFATTFGDSQVFFIILLRIIPNIQTFLHGLIL